LAGLDDRPSREVKIRILDAPSMLARLNALLWVGAALLGLVFGSLHDLGLGAILGLIFVLSGGSVTAITYLLAERALRPLARIALAAGVPDRAVENTMARRMLLTWVFGTGAGVGGDGVRSLVRDWQACRHDPA